MKEGLVPLFLFLFLIPLILLFCWYFMQWKLQDTIDYHEEVTLRRQVTAAALAVNAQAAPTEAAATAAATT
jgi:CHASE3 domain sensor protein